MSATGNPSPSPSPIGIERHNSAQSLNTFENFIDGNPKSDIILPNQNLEIEHISIDIGGSLAKIVWFTKQDRGGRLHFRKFETSKMEQIIEFLDTLLVGKRNVTIKATGGGSHKYQQLIETRLNVKLLKEDEMESLITGLNFLVRQIENEVFTYDERRSVAMQFEKDSQIFPYMVVNIGSGVSILKVTSDETYERISGTSLGGGTLWGLLGLLTNARDYDEMLEISKLGDNKNVDMLVGDIYGGDYSKIGLKSTTIASSFGKVIKVPAKDRKSSFKQEDIAVSLLYLVSNNIGQIAYLNAQAHGISNIYFSGFYISGHAITMNTLSYAISFWSRGKMKAKFLRHEGYLGAIGAFLKDPPVQSLSSFQENFSQVELGLQGKYGLGTLEQHTHNIGVFPLLVQQGYSPDTISLESKESQNYWIDLLDLNLQSLVNIACEKERESKSRADMFESMYRKHLLELRQNPNAYGPLTVRGLLQLREQCLREMGFNDIFLDIKSKENLQALELLDTHFANLDMINEEHNLIETLIDNAIAGNMFDWGSTLIQELIKTGKLSFDDAKVFEINKNKIGRAPDLDHRRQLATRLVEGKPYKKAMMFLDNSGVDLCFGMLPIARHLIKMGTQVILAVNTWPSVNDVTYNELEQLLTLVKDPIIRDAFNSNKLSIVATGSGSPCLDFMRLSEETCKLALDVDFLIIEGMGRAIHTNFYAKFKVDTLKIASFKNPHVAALLGCKMYDGMATFQLATTE